MSSRIPGAESGRGTLTAFRLPKESDRRAHFPDLDRRQSWDSRTWGRGHRGQETRCRAPATRARWVPCQSRGSGQGQAAFHRGTKVGLTPSAAGRCPGQPTEQPRVPPGPWAPRVGEGTSPATPPPPRRRDLLIRISTASRCRSSLTSAPRLPPILPPRPLLNTAETTAPSGT